MIICINRLAWSLVHCEDTSKIPLGLEMSKTLLEHEEEEDKREAKYYIAGNLNECEKDNDID